MVEYETDAWHVRYVLAYPNSVPRVQAYGKQTYPSELAKVHAEQLSKHCARVWVEHEFNGTVIYESPGQVEHLRCFDQKCQDAPLMVSDHERMTIAYAGANAAAVAKRTGIAQACPYDSAACNEPLDDERMTLWWDGFTQTMGNDFEVLGTPIMIQETAVGDYMSIYSMTAPS